MIDPERVLVIFLGSLTAALFLLAIALVSDVDWKRWGELLRRFIKYWRMSWTEDDTRFVRLCYVALLVTAWLKGS